MRILTGDECGLLKEFLPSQVKAPPSKDAVDPTAAVVVTSDGIRRINAAESMARRNAVVGLSWMPEHRHFAALRVDGTVQVWEGAYEAHQAGTYRPNVEIPRVFSGSDDENETASASASASSSSDDDTNNPPRAIGIHSWSTHNRLVACNITGTIAVIDAFAQEQENCVVKKFETFASAETKSKQQQQQQQQSSSKPSIIQTTAFALNPEEGIAAVGAKDRETVLWDVNTGTQVWKAKNLPPDPQTLLQPRVWPTTACFFPDNRNFLAVGSAYHQVRIYDVRTPSSSTSNGAVGAIKMQRRPIQYTDEKNTYLEHRITALCPLPSSHELVVGDAGGCLQSLDLRQLAGGASVRRHRATPVLGRFAGPAGSVRQLALHSSDNSKPRLACVGLDRMLRIYDVRSRRQLQTVYLKQRLNCVLVSDEALVEDDNDNDSDIDQEDNVQDYVDSDNEENDDDEDGGGGDGDASVEVEDDAVVETIDGIPPGSSSEGKDDDDDDDDEDASSNEDDASGGGDSNDGASSEEAEMSPRKRRRR